MCRDAAVHVDWKQYRSLPEERPRMAAVSQPVTTKHNPSYGGAAKAVERSVIIPDSLAVENEILDIDDVPIDAPTVPFPFNASAPFGRSPVRVCVWRAGRVAGSGAAVARAGGHSASVCVCVSVRWGAQCGAPWLRGVSCVSLAGGSVRFCHSSKQTASKDELFARWGPTYTGNYQFFDGAGGELRAESFGEFVEVRWRRCVCPLPRLCGTAAVVCVWYCRGRVCVVLPRSCVCGTAAVVCVCGTAAVVCVWYCRGCVCVVLPRLCVRRSNVAAACRVARVRS